MENYSWFSCWHEEISQPENAFTFPNATIALVSENDQIALTQWLTNHNLQHQCIHLTIAKVALHPCSIDM